MVRDEQKEIEEIVAPREGRVSRNYDYNADVETKRVAPREGRVSRNSATIDGEDGQNRRAPRGACE